MAKDKDLEVLKTVIPNLDQMNRMIEEARKKPAYQIELTPNAVLKTSMRKR